MYTTLGYMTDKLYSDFNFSLHSLVSKQYVKQHTDMHIQPSRTATSCLLEMSLDSLQAQSSRISFLVWNELLDNKSFCFFYYKENFPLSVYFTCIEVNDSDLN